jgi:Flp pilus assembly pilin Flp
MKTIQKRMAWVRALVIDRLTFEDGQDMVEYALLAALISIVAIGIILFVGPALKSEFQDIVNALQQA